jgi:endonuclease YncB( thermonuclease family)
VSEFYRYRVLFAEAVDGDTVDLVLDVGFRHQLRDRFRLYGPDPDAPMGLDAPELRTPEGRAAKEFLAKLLNGLMITGATLVAHTLKDRREKYGRWLVVLKAEGTRNVNLELVTAGHAKLREY